MALESVESAPSEESDELALAEVLSAPSEQSKELALAEVLSAAPSEVGNPSPFDEAKESWFLEWWVGRSQFLSDCCQHCAGPVRHEFLAVVLCCASVHPAVVERRGFVRVNIGYWYSDPCKGSTRLDGARDRIPPPLASRQIPCDTAS